MKAITILCPTGHLGFTPFETASFEAGTLLEPDFIIADSGSCDIGPYPLGADGQASPIPWQRHDLAAMLRAARRLGVPMIIGSASDTGTDRGVDLFVQLIEEIAREDKMAPFKLAAIYAEQSRDALKAKLSTGTPILGLDGRADADASVLDRTDHIVAVMGAEPMQQALREGAEVVIAGRSSDCAIFAAPLLNAGFSPAIAYYAGKLMECASFCAEPFMGKESIFGRITAEAVEITAMHPGQRCTPLSVASHSMYERRNPFREHVVSGYVDMTDCRYEVADSKTCRATGPVFVPSVPPRAKLEGAGKLGERRLAVVGMRDPYMIQNIDKAIAWARARLAERFGSGEERGWQIHYHLYGRNGVMGDLEIAPPVQPHELGIVVEVVCKDAALAEQVCALGARNLFYARLPEVKGTAGTAALMADEVLIGKPGYEWTLNHTIAVEDASELFTIEHRIIDGRGA